MLSPHHHLQILLTPCFFTSQVNGDVDEEEDEEDTTEDEISSESDSDSEGKGRALYLVQEIAVHCLLMKKTIGCGVKSIDQIFDQLIVKKLDG